MKRKITTALMNLGYLAIIVMLSACGGGGGGGSDDSPATGFTAQMLDASPTYYVTYSNDIDGTTQETIVFSGTEPDYTATITEESYDSNEAFVDSTTIIVNITLNLDGTLTAKILGEADTTVTLTNTTATYLDVDGNDGTDTWSDFWYFAPPAGWLPGGSDLWQGTWTLNTQETDWGEGFNNELPFYVGSYFEINGNSLRVVFVRDGLVETDVTGTFSVEGTTFTANVEGETLVGTYDLQNDNTKAVIYWSEAAGGDTEVYDKAPAIPVYAFGSSSYLQYRVFEDVTGVFQGWLPMTKNGVPIQDADIVDILLFDSQNNAILPTNGAFQSQVFMYLDCTGVSCVESGPRVEHAYWSRYNLLEADTYRLEVNTVDDQILTKTIPYAGQLVLPIVTIDAMQSAWNGNNLVLSWTNPVGAATWPDVDKLRIIIYDGSGETVLNVQMNPTAQSVILDEGLLTQAKALGDGILESWEVQTRAYDENNMNFARSTLKGRAALSAGP